MRKLWIVTEAFYPDETSTAHILSEIAISLSSIRDIEVISETPLVNQEPKPSIKIHSITKTQKVGKENFLNRGVRLVLLSIKLWWKYILLSKKKDEVLIVTNPTFLVPLMGITIRLRKTPAFLLVHDIFPDNLSTLGKINKKSLVYSALTKLYNYSYKSFEKLIVLGRDMEEVILEKIFPLKRTVIIENWADTDRIFSKENIKLNPDEIVFQYAGNLGPLQKVEDIIAIFNNLDNKNIKLEIWGRGNKKDEIIQLINNLSKKNIQFKGSYTRDEENNVLNTCDIGIVSLSDEMYGLGVPSKAYNILAAGKPILFIGNKNSEIAQMVKENNVGWVFSWENTDSIISFIHYIKSNEIFRTGIKSRKLADTQYSKTKILNKYKGFF